MAWWNALGRRLARRAGPPEDARGRRLIVVIECILNQNARDAGAARAPAMNRDVVRLCADHDVGLLQMPCPEIACLGWKRERPHAASIRDALDTPAGRRCCAGIAEEAAGRVEEYLRQGHRVLAVLGGNAASPGCAVHRDGAGLLPSSGVFMLELRAALRRRDIEIPFRGMRDDDPEGLAEDVAWLQGILAGAGAAAVPGGVVSAGTSVRGRTSG